VLTLSGDHLHAHTHVCARTRAHTRARASRVASASAAIERCNWTGKRTSLISTRSTLMPQLSVASSRMF
jgi:hypothetical protein